MCPGLSHFSCVHTERENAWKHAETMPKYKVGDRALVKLSGGRIVEATVKAVIEKTDGTRLQVSFGHETALIYLWQVVKTKHAVGPRILLWLSLSQGFVNQVIDGV